MKNCSWSISNDLPFTQQSLQYQLDSFPSSITIHTWNDVLSTLYDLLMKYCFLFLSYQIE